MGLSYYNQSRDWKHLKELCIHLKKQGKIVKEISVEVNVCNETILKFLEEKFNKLFI